MQLLGHTNWKISFYSAISFNSLFSQMGNMKRLISITEADFNFILSDGIVARNAAFGNAHNIEANAGTGFIYIYIYLNKCTYDV